MQFRDLKAQYQHLKPEIDRAIREVIDSSQFILGKPVNDLEEALARYVGVKHCVSCGNGTDALELVLEAWGIGEGDAVFAPDFTFFATGNCAMRRGAEVVLVDIDARTFNISVSELEAAVDRTLAEGRLTPKAIIPVDLFGQCANYPEIRRIAQKYGLRVLEDGAQGFGGEIEGRKACSFGDAGATSFFPAKPLGCYGDGGAVFTDDDELAGLLRSIRAQGRSPQDKYDNRDIGINSRLDTLQAAILMPKFRAFCSYELDAVDRAAEMYTQRLRDIVITPQVPQGYRSSWAQYTILVEDIEQRRMLQESLRADGIPTMVYYPRGMHQQTAVRKYGFDRGEFPNTEAVVQRCLSLPMHPYLKEEDIDRIAGRIRALLS